MAEAVYDGEDDSFAVEITRAGVLPEMAVGFVTEAQAHDWIAQDKKIMAGCGYFQGAGESEVSRVLIGTTRR